MIVFVGIIIVVIVYGEADGDFMFCNRLGSVSRKEYRKISDGRIQS